MASGAGTSGALFILLYWLQSDVGRMRHHQSSICPQLDPPDHWTVRRKVHARLAMRSSEVVTTPFIV